MYLETTRQETRTTVPGETGGESATNLKTLMAEYRRASRSRCGTSTSCPRCSTPSA
jgi:hypothetical protein